MSAPPRPPLAILGHPHLDRAWLVGPGLLAAAVALVMGARSPAPTATGVGLWIVGVLLVDVAHVWASLYRTYLDPVARRLHRGRLIATPLGCAGIGFVVHLASPAAFWSALAYLAIFHFIKQHVGFALIYARAGGEGSFDRRLVEAAVWAGTAGPVLWWHAHLPTNFVWFVPGDLLPVVPAWLGPAALWGQVPVWLLFVARRVQLRGRSHPMVPWLVLVPAINWHLGIVWFDDDRIFTITNVFLHGVPYLALVWVAGGRQRVRAALGPRGRGLLPALAAYYGLLVVLAVGEEALWDRLVWHDHPGLFGPSRVELSEHPVLMAIVVAGLTVPQATHYVLDRFIWRVGPLNPQLAEQLGLRGQP